MLLWGPIPFSRRLLHVLHTPCPRCRGSDAFFHVELPDAELFPENPPLLQGMVRVACFFLLPIFGWLFWRWGFRAASPVARALFRARLASDVRCCLTLS